MKEIEVTGFYINYDGDPSVGIFPQEWEITGGFIFNCEEDLKRFKDEILSVFELCSDTPLFIETFEERKERLKQKQYY